MLYKLYRSNLFLIIVFAVGFAVAYFFVPAHKASGSCMSAEEKALLQGGKVDTENPKLFAELGRISCFLHLPNEIPVAVPVANVAELKQQQTFYQNAEDGDTLLIFKNAGQALIYRDNENILVNAGGFVVGGTNTPANTPPAPEASTVTPTPAVTPAPAPVKKSTKK